jgi:predicted site-specific integrase-resolvase
MKLSEYAQRMSVSYKTAWRWWRVGQLDASQVASGTIIVRESAPTAIPRPTVERVAVSARVSAAVNRPHLEGQVDRLVAYGGAKGSQFYQGVKEVGAGVNDGRPQFL